MKNKKYLGYFNYFATGEGFSEYLKLIFAPNEEDAIDTFCDDLVFKMSNQKIINAKETAPEYYEWAKVGIKIYDLETFNIDDIKSGYISRRLLEDVKLSALEGSMINNDFEYWFQFNRG